MRWLRGFFGCDFQQHTSQMVATVSQWITAIEGIPRAKEERARNCMGAAAPRFIYSYTYAYTAGPAALIMKAAHDAILFKIGHY